MQLTVEHNEYWPMDGKVTLEMSVGEAANFDTAISHTRNRLDPRLKANGLHWILEDLANILKINDLNWETTYERIDAINEQNRVNQVA